MEKEESTNYIFTFYLEILFLMYIIQYDVHRLITIQIERQFFQDLGVFPFTITLRQKPKKVTRMLILCLVIQQFNAACELLLQAICLRFIVHEKPQNLEKTTHSVLSGLLLIYDKDSFVTRAYGEPTEVNVLIRQERYVLQNEHTF